MESRPYLFSVQGGPGFSSLSMELAMTALEKESKNTDANLPNMIFYDPVGCGASDKAEDIAAEYTMENFTEIAAQVVEVVKEKLIPQQKMDLRLYGGSFGALTVMDLPVHRPKWLDENSDIRLRQIISNVGPNGADTKEYARKYLEDHFAGKPGYEEIRAALYKLLDGKIEDQQDYLRFVFNMAPLYSDSLAEFKNSFIGQRLVNNPGATIWLLKAVNKLLRSEVLTYMIEGMTGCSIDVLNHFFATDFGGFNLNAQVAQHSELYSKVSICLIASELDHMVDYRYALDLNKLLPNSSAAITLKEKHQVARGPNKDTFTQILLGLICRGHIPGEALAQPLIGQHTVDYKFQDQLAELAKPLRWRDSTTYTMGSLLLQDDSTSAHSSSPVARHIDDVELSDLLGQSTQSEEASRENSACDLMQQPKALRPTL